MTATAALQGQPASVLGASRHGRLRSALSTPSGRVGAGVVAVIVLVGVLAPLLAPHDPLFQQSGASLLRPSAGHLLGTDEVGRDVLSRVLYGLRQDIVVAIVAVPIGQAIGVTVGLLASLHRSADVVVQRVLDVLIAFPYLILGAALAAFLGPGFRTVLVVIIVGSIPMTARLTRTAVLSQRERDYVRGAQVIGVGPVGVLFSHILPNALEALVVNFFLSAASAMFVEGGLSLLGFGIRPPSPSLGSMIETGLPYIGEQKWYVLTPILVLTTLVIGLNMLAGALNRAIRQG